MKAIRCSIPKGDWLWPIPRPLWVSIHGFDWAPIMHAPKPMPDFSLHARLLGLGADLRYNRPFKFYMLSLGARWLLQITVGSKGRPTGEVIGLGGNIAPSSLYLPTRFLEISLFGWALSIGKDEGRPLRVRLFGPGYGLVWPKRKSRA